jgi:hypothetical protein
MSIGCESNQVSTISFVLTDASTSAASCVEMLPAPPRSAISSERQGPALCRPWTAGRPPGCRSALTVRFSAEPRRLPFALSGGPLRRGFPHGFQPG